MLSIWKGYETMASFIILRNSRLRFKQSSELRVRRLDFTIALLVY